MTQHDCEPPRDAAGIRRATRASIGTGENVFTVLADQARARSRAALWTTVIGALLNAGLVLWQYRGMSWLVAGFVATAAYGGWGLFDRAIAMTEAWSDAEARSDVMPEMRGLLAVVGTGAALWAVLGFIAAALGNWNH